MVDRIVHQTNAENAQGMKQRAVYVVPRRSIKSSPQQRKTRYTDQTIDKDYTVTTSKHTLYRPLFLLVNKSMHMNNRIPNWGFVRTNSLDIQKPISQTFRGFPALSPGGTAGFSN
jgi:hypothetical protein